METTEKIYGRDYGNIPKPNQEIERKTIESILENEFKISCEVNIFATVLPEPNKKARWRRFSYKFNNDPINTIKRIFTNGLSETNGEPAYNQLTITANPKYLDRYSDIHKFLLERFKEFGIEYIYYKSKKKPKKRQPI